MRIEPRMWRYILCRWCEPPVWKRQQAIGPEGRHNEIASALRALDGDSLRLPVAYTTGKGCVVPLGLQVAQYQNASATTIPKVLCAREQQIEK